MRVGIALLLVAGCVGPTVGYRAFPGPYSRSEVAQGAGNRDLRVEVRVTATESPLQQVAAAVAAAVPNGVGINTRFTASPDASANPAYALVFVFNPAPGSGPLSYCDAETRPVPSTGRFEVSAAFCRFGAPFTGAALPIDGPDDKPSPRFLF